jgi:hypothetical protein
MSWESTFDEQFDTAIKKKYDIKQQEADTQKANQIATAPMYAAQANMLNDTNQMHRDVAGLQYGQGGSVDRTNLAQQPLRTAQANYYDTSADENRFKLGIAQENRPNIVSAGKSVNDLNAYTNLSELETKVDTNFAARNKKFGDLWGQKYSLTNTAQPRGWAQKLWEGDLVNPFSTKNALEDAQETAVRKLNESYYKNNPLARPR